MRMGDVIYNLDGLPFRSHELAQRMVQLLAGETQSAVAYTVESHITGGYVVRREQPNGPLGLIPWRAATPSGPVQSSASSCITVEDQTAPAYRFRPAVVRSNLRWVPVLILSVVLTAMPEVVLGSVRQVFHLSPSLLGEWWIPTTQALRRASEFMAGGILLFFWSERISAAYHVTDTGVEARVGILARSSVALRYVDIRSVTLNQSLANRLLNIGTLEFTSAGSNGQPVRFEGVGRPLWIKEIVEARMERCSAD
jgi:hypothetical protein